MRMTMTLVALFTITTVFSRAQCNQTTSCQTISPEEVHNVFEQVTKSTSGTQEYVLSSLPSSQLSTHVFRNGLELNSASDYQISGQTLTLTPTGMTAASDVITAAYTTTRAQPDEGTRTLNSASDAGALVLSSYLDRALKQELQSSGQTRQLKRAPDASQFVSTRVNPTIIGSTPATFTSTQQQPASLRMLSRALRSSTNSGRQSKGSRARSAGEIGLSGIGDEMAASPYDLLTQKHGDLNSLLTDVGSSDRSTRVEPTEHTGEIESPASLRMLVNLLDKRGEK